MDSRHGRLSISRIVLLITVFFGSFSLGAAQSSTASASASASTSSSASISANSSGSTSGSVSVSATSSTSASSTTSADLPSLSGLSSCVGNCFLTAIAQVNCSNVTPESCYCNNTNYQPALVSCISSSCSNSSELISAENLTNQFCALASPSTSISFSITSLQFSSSSSAVSSTSRSGSASITSPTPASTSASSTGSSSTGAPNGAASSRTVGVIGKTTSYSTALVLFGAVSGALLVL
ncbi:hypothetical protein D9757_012462 [Collybiopsis confluens]|uniref:CFEM domain-containing protein n=1 Tax=Collybiopsis confluens TaxID=2823264 RepID=A0A8H5G181_9AGAR|nr:hypothetical protein D9757_012462 [Collybiopsis confluens]